MAELGGSETPCPVTVGSLSVSPRAATCPTVGLPIRYQIEARIGTALEVMQTRYEQRAAAGASKLDANSHSQGWHYTPHPIWMRLSLVTSPRSGLVFSAALSANAHAAEAGSAPPAHEPS